EAHIEEKQTKPARNDVANKHLATNAMSKNLTLVYDESVIGDAKGLKEKLAAKAAEKKKTDKELNKVLNQINVDIKVPGKCEKTCQSLKFANPPLPWITANPSFPGSGSTWSRFLMQQITGIPCGSVYHAKSECFPGEGVQDETVLCVKTHGQPKHYNFFTRAVIIIRNCRDTLIAERKRRSLYDVRRGSINMLMGQDWNAWSELKAVAWREFYLSWLNTTKDIHILTYEKLLKDVRGELSKIAQFFNMEIAPDILDCVVENKDSRSRRASLNATAMKNFDPFSSTVSTHIDQNMKIVCEAIKNRFPKEECAFLKTH
ncbi:unnamed protein product, partial [Owenia fusiformis]